MKTEVEYSFTFPSERIRKAVEKLPNLLVNLAACLVLSIELETKNIQDILVDLIKQGA